jgi:hypothetical protein
VTFSKSVSTCWRKPTTERKPIGGALPTPKEQILFLYICADHDSETPSFLRSDGLLIPLTLSMSP